jgi:hypothetical protein
MTTWTISNEIFPAPLGDYETIMRRINDTVFRRKLVQANAPLQPAVDLVIKSQLDELTTARSKQTVH